MEELHTISHDVDPIVSYIDSIPRLAVMCNKMGCMVGDEITINMLLNDALEKLTYLPIKEVCYTLQCTEEDLKQKKKQFVSQNKSEKQRLEDLLPPPAPLPVSITPKSNRHDNIQSSSNNSINYNGNNS